MVFRKVDVQNGKQQMFFERPGDETLFGSAALSLDGKEIFFSLCKPGAKQPADQKITTLNAVRLMRRNLKSEEEKELYRYNLGRSRWGWSKDGRYIIVVQSDPSSGM